MKILSTDPGNAQVVFHLTALTFQKYFPKCSAQEMKPDRFPGSAAVLKGLSWVGCSGTPCPSSTLYPRHDETPAPIESPSLSLS